MILCHHHIFHKQKQKSFVVLVFGLFVLPSVLGVQYRLLYKNRVQNLTHADFVIIEALLLLRYLRGIVFLGALL